MLLFFSWNCSPIAGALNGYFEVTWPLTIKLVPAKSLWAGNIAKSMTLPANSTELGLKTLNIISCYCNNFVITPSRSKCTLFQNGRHLNIHVFLQISPWCLVLKFKIQKNILCWTRQQGPIDHFTVVCLVTWPLNESEAGVDLALIETSLLFLC